MEVLINGRPRDISARSVSYEQIVGIACWAGAEGAAVTYREYDPGSPEAALLPGQSILPRAGMVFTVTRDGTGGTPLVPVTPGS